tara:strand:+ start:80 stop:850 length:771 start_codon:yes stop_codon:yes gene_type:complete
MKSDEKAKKTTRLPRKPIPYELAVDNIDPNDYKDVEGNIDGISYAKDQSRNMLVGYLKQLQLIMRDAFIQQKQEEWTDEEKTLWTNEIIRSSRLVVEQYSMMELIEQKREMFKSDPDGKLSLDPKLIDPYLASLKDGTIVLDTNAMARDEAMVDIKFKERLAQLKLQYEKEYEEAVKERSQYENDRKLHPEDYDKDGNLILRDEKWVEETKKAIQDAQDEIKKIRDEKLKRENNMKKQKEKMVLEDLPSLDNESSD